MATDEILAGAARALLRGEALLALNLVGRAEGAQALMLRGIAYAQLGDLDLAEVALSRALDGLAGPLERARARAALAEIALTGGDPARALRDAIANADELHAVGDHRNAATQRLVVARAHVLLGHLREARAVVADVLAPGHAHEIGPDVRAVALLAQAEIAVRAIAPREAMRAIAEARRILERAPHALLGRALSALEQDLSRPVARLLDRGVAGEADLFAIEKASRGESLLVDACRRIALAGNVTVPLARRPVLFALLDALARAWPAPVPRDDLAGIAFEVRAINASHRARLRVEIGRLRKLVAGLGAGPVATAEGYTLASTRDILVLAPPSEGADARLALLLGDGALWSARSLAEHAGVSVRTAQRALARLVESGEVVRAGAGKDLRYARPGTPIASRMLLLGLVPTA